MKSTILAKGRRDGLNEHGLLGGEHGAKVENETVGFDAGDDADAGGSAAEALLELRGGVARAGDADKFCGKGLSWSGAAADKGSPIDDVEFHFRAGFVFAERDFGSEFAQEVYGAALDFGGGEANHPQRGDFVIGGAKVGAESRFERGDGELVYTKRAEERVAANSCDEVFFPGDDAGLRAAEKFVAAEHYDVRAGFDAMADEGLDDAVRGEIDEAAGAEVFDKREISARGESGEILQRWFVGEAGDLEIRWVNAEEHARFFGDGVFVVCEARAVGGADFTECGAALRHDFRDAEAVADFDEFAARDEDFAVASEGGEDEEDGGGAVVDDDSRFGAGEAFEELRGVNIALAAGAHFEVVLEIRILRGGAAEFFDGGFGERGAAEVGVEDDAGGVDHGLERLGKDLLDGVGDFVL